MDRFIALNVWESAKGADNFKIQYGQIYRKLFGISF